MTPFSVISYSFKNSVRDGAMDIFSYIDTCKEIGCAALDPWAAHLSKLKDPAKVIYTGEKPGQAEVVLDAEDHAFLDEVKAKAAQVGLPFGCIATDGPTYIYEPEDWKREINRKLARRWIDAAAYLGAKQVRIDPGQWHEPKVPDEVMAIFLDGYRDHVRYGRERGVEILIENHWGCSNQPDVLVHLLENVEGLGLLLDTNNWATGKQGEGWLRCAKYARATHVKCHHWAEDGDELNQHVGHAVQLLKKSGYEGFWGIESVPKDPNVSELEGVRRTMRLIERYLAE